MTLSRELAEAIINKYFKKREHRILSLDSSHNSERLLKELAYINDDDYLGIKIIPSSARMASIIKQLGFELSSINDKEIDLGIEFADKADDDFNYIKQNSYSLIRDKMIAQSAGELLVIVREKGYEKKINSGIIPFEISPFGWKRTLIQLQGLGEAELRMDSGKKFKTESGNYLIDINVNEISSVEDFEFQAKDIPGVLETGLFIGYADRILSFGEKIKVKSRMR